jgi:hypothetical protein
LYGLLRVSDVTFYERIAIEPGKPRLEQHLLPQEARQKVIQIGGEAAS